MSASEFIHHPHRPSIRRRLMVATLLPVFLACLSLGLLVTGITYLYGRDMIVNHLNSQARSKHGEILSWTDDLQGELRFLLVGENSRNLLENILGGNAVSSQIAEARKLFQENAQACRFIEEIFLLSPEGYVLVSTNPAHEGEYRGHLEYFQEGQKKSSVHVQTSAASAEQLNRVFAVIPLMPEGNTGVGVLCGRASLDRLQSIISQYSGMGETAESFLVGENMVPLTFIESRRYSPGTSYIQSENIQSTIGESESQLRFAEDYRGVPVVGVYRWIPSIRAVLVIKQDQSEAFAPLRMTVLIQVVVALLAAIFAVALSMGLSRGIIHPINDLASATRAISMGEFRQRVQTEGRPEEIASLATAFNTMSDQIQRMFVETRRSEQRFRNLVETSIDWIWEIDPQGVCTYSSPRVKDVLGYEPNEIVGGQARELMSEDVRKEAGEFFNEHIRKQQPFHQNQVAFLHKEGHRVILELSAMPFWSNEGEFAGFRGISRDVTWRLEAEQALRDSEENLRITLQALDDAVISTDNEGKIVRMNRRTEELTGWKAEKARGRDINDVLELRDQERPTEVLDCYVADILETGESKRFKGHAFLVSRDGERHIVSHRGSPIRDSEGEMVGAVIVIRDVTDEHRLAERLRHSEKMDAIGQLAGGIAHDFNNLLSGIIGNAELIEMSMNENEESQNGEETEKCAAEISHAAHRAADLTRQLLNFSRKAQIRSIPMDLHHVIDQTLSILSRSIDRRIQITKEFEAQKAALIGDPTQVENAFLNLGLNARDAMPDGGELRVYTRNVHISDEDARETALPEKPGTYIEIMFSDTGVGMEREVQKHIFEPFFTTKDSEQGTGLGLASVYACVQAHSGVIRVYSEKDHGTTFKILLPVGSDGDAVEQAVSRPVSRPRIDARIMVIDDEDIVRRAVTRALERYGAHVESFADGQSAIEFYRERHEDIDLIILDLVMPDLNGSQVFEQIQAIAPDTPVILASGFGQNQMVEDILSKGASLFLSKPFNIRELVSAIERFLSGKKES